MTGATFGVSHAELRHIAQRLAESATWLATGVVLAGAPGAEPYDEIVSAVRQFDEDWSHATTRLCDETAGLGERVTETSRRIAEHDDSAAGSVRALSTLLSAYQVEPAAAGLRKRDLAGG